MYIRTTTIAHILGVDDSSIAQIPVSGWESFAVEPEKSAILESDTLRLQMI